MTFPGRGRPGWPAIRRSAHRVGGPLPLDFQLHLRRGRHDGEDHGPPRGSDLSDTRPAVQFLDEGEQVLRRASQPVQRGDDQCDSANHTWLSRPSMWLTTITATTAPPPTSPRTACMRPSHHLYPGCRSGPLTRHARSAMVVLPDLAEHSTRRRERPADQRPADPTGCVRALGRGDGSPARRTAAPVGA